MKKLTALLMTALLLLTLAACAGNKDAGQQPDPQQPAVPETPVPETPAPETPPADGGTETDAETQELIDLFTQINDGVEVMALSTDPIPDDMWSSYLFIDKIDGAKAVVSQSQVGSVAHCAALVRVPAGTDAQTVADDIKAKADPRKWVCVEAESVQTAVRGDLVFFVMSDQATADNMVKNFGALALDK